MSITSYRIDRTGEIVLPLWALDAARERVAKLARRAKRLGLAEPQLVELGACQTRYVVTRDGVGRPVHAIVDQIVVKVEGERPVLPGHTLLGTVEPVGDEYLVFAAPAAAERELNLTQYAGNGCDHCKTKRQRKLLVLVEREDGVVVRVGRECVQSYLPGVSVDALVEAAGYARSLDGIVEEFEGFGGFRGERLLYVPSVVAQGFACVRVDGSYKPAALEENSTRWLVDELLYLAEKPNPSGAELKLARKYAVTQADRDLADAAIAWARELTPRSDFEHNLHVCAKAEHIRPKRLGVIVAIIPGFNRELVKRSERKECVSEHTGTVGKREVFKNLLCKVAYEIDGIYGTSTIYVFEDEAGRALKWKATGAARLHKGWRYDLKGTVKEHGEYKGTKQTVLSRCAVLAEHEPAEVKAEREAKARELKEREAAFNAELSALRAAAEAAHKVCGDGRRHTPECHAARLAVTNLLARWR